jgi:hypothetical protein
MSSTQFSEESALTSNESSPLERLLKKTVKCVL